MSTPPPISRLDRVYKLLHGLDVADARGIEIGALASPILRRPDADVRYVDHADHAALRTKYADDEHVVKDDIVSVDAIWGDNTLAECFPGVLFEYVIASHVIEHVPNVIGWLTEIADVLRADGRLILAIPDRNYCFDVARRETSLSDLIDNYLRSVRRPTPGQIFDANAYALDFDHVAAWSSPRRTSTSTPFVTRAHALARALESLDGRYIDGHCSVFSAKSLLQLLSDLIALDLMPFRLERFHIAAAGSAEMILVVLRQPPDADRVRAQQTIDRMLQNDVDSEGLPLEPYGGSVASAPIDDPRVALLEHALSVVRASTSWRVTAPLRAASRLVRRAMPDGHLTRRDSAGSCRGP